MKFFLLVCFFLINVHAVDFKKDIEPIFEQKCSKCHGEKKQKSDLRLDSRQNLLVGGDLGKPTVVPGKPAESTLVKLISLDEDHDDIMPPKGSPLSKDEIKLITDWISEGAIMPEKKLKEEATLWSLKPIVKTNVPQSQNAVDFFLQKKLAEKSLSFSHEASPETLLRRLQVTLTGFLPSPEESASFLKEWSLNRDKAYSHKVEELLSSPHFGERWAQHWLDSIRWAETSGSESNLYRKFSWQYRDYVINAFNDDKPYDQFIIDQLAGDQTGNPRATGFLVSGPHVPPATVGQEPSAMKEARYDRLDQIMQTVGASMMGMTLGCARCHTHKFDPIKINDYYSILANFQDTEFGIRKPKLHKNSTESINDEQIMAKIKSFRKQRKAGVSKENWVDHLQLHFSQKNIKALRLTFPRKKVFLDEVNILDVKGKDISKLANISTNLTGPRAEISKLTDGEIGNFYALRGEVRVKEKGFVQFSFDEVQKVDHFQISSDRKKINNTDYEISNYGKAPNFMLEVMTEDGQWQTLTRSIYSLPEHKEIQKLITKKRQVGTKYEFIGRFINPEKTHVLLRGSPFSLGAEVPPNGLSTITKSLGMSSDTPGPERRLKFAQWLANEENPLTARVMVNRLWHHTFGTGLVSTLSDFGNAGAKPSHPELLDYLTAEFTKQNWSVKNILRKLVHSKAFKQDNKPVDQALKVDSDSRLLWRFPPRRADAEVLRDSVLKLTASLNSKLGGISYRIYNTKKRYELWSVVDNHSEKTWRRMIYQERMRGIDDRMFTAFDFPDCGQVLSKRPSSTTPLQALNLMNSKFIETQCNILANKVHSSNKSDAVKALFQTVYNRQPDNIELQKSLELLKTESMQILCRALLNSNEFVFIQ
ncbi:MAG: PSD1 and planctomycete cytochrome C domain-containing protein [Lentisphaeraceae bacterium]|nr:PSD1 and planctomycete cytochrome C domain-containing protein [Lentisphaeraceae bacterium]